MSSVGSGGKTFFLIISSLFLFPSEVWSGFACLSNPCIHGVCLDDLNSTYFCYCIDGYTGVQCQTNWNECWSSPCQNGGICIDGIASFNCSCPPGFIGDLCEEDLNECESNPCWNNGTCLDSANGYNCSCLPGYSGVHCELDVAVCNTTNETRCANGGVCVEGPGDSFSCTCPPGWEGLLCEMEINECLLSPCKNGAVCIDHLADYTCACLFGYSGRNCDETVKICDKNPCSNGALCLIEEQNPICYCVPDFHGDLCQFQYDECQLGPKCLNGGTCVDGIDNSTCSCPPNLTGVRCECLILDEDELDCTYTSPEPTSTFVTEPIYKSTVPKYTNATSIPSEKSTLEITESTIFTTSLITETTLSTLPELSSEETTLTSVQINLSTTESQAFTETTTSHELPLSSTLLTTELVSTTEYNEISTTLTTAKETTFSSTLGSTLPTITTTSLDSHLFTTAVTANASTITIPSTKELDISTTPGDLFTSTTEMMSTEFFDCTKNYCQNGGTCIYTPDNSYKCVCPFGTEGSLCEILLGIQRVAFTGNAYLKHNLQDTTNISLQLDAKTLYDKGLIFFVNTDSNYMVLFIEGGHLKFKFSCGYQTMLLSEMKLLISNGDLMNIKANLEFSNDFKRCYASVSVNNSLSMSGDQIALRRQFSKSTGWLYLGGIPNAVINIELPHPGFVGCMSKLKISDKPVDIFKDAEDGFDVRECASLACLSNPCQNGASCVSKGEKWSCSCKNGFSGKMCEKSVCETNPCLFGATCIPFSGSGYICLCPYGKHGHFCENDFKINKPNFASTIRGLASYLAYPIPGEGSTISDRMTLRFKFIPSVMDQISILMFIGQRGQHGYYSDHVAVSFVKGYVMLTWNLGSGPRRIFTSQPIEASAKEHLVQIGRSGRRAWLSVDNLGNVTGRSPGNLVLLDVFPILYIGGHDSTNFSTLPHDLPLHTGFTGCIFDVELISANVVIPLQSSKQTFGRGVGDCGSTECYEHSCENNGICLHHASTFMCLCQDGWFGPLCTSTKNPCDDGYHKCGEGAICVPTLSEYECDCPAGKTGQYCEKDEDITDITFTGRRSYLSLPTQELIENKFNIEMELRPLDDYGLILFIEKKDSSFISLVLSSGSVELTIFSSKHQSSLNEPTTITSTKVLTKGIWHKLQFGLFGKKAYLSVDNVITSGILYAESGINLSHEFLYLGGLPDFSLLPIFSVSQLPIYYKGCIRYFLINSIQIPLNKERIRDARNIRDCDGTPCGKDYCLNGGSCWLDSLMKPHCSCLNPYFGVHCENVSECNNTACRNTGQCVDAKCSCKLGWEGVYCERKIKVITPEFVGQSFLMINSKKKRHLVSDEIKYIFANFTTVKDNGLLLWSKKENTFIGIGFENGFVKIAYSFDNQNTSAAFSLASHYKISNGLWHSLEIVFNPLLIKLDQLKIPSKGKHREILGKNFLLTNGEFYLGGIPTKSVSKETNGLFLDTFEGCIEAFAFTADYTIKDFSNFQGREINVCKIP